MADLDQEIDRLYALPLAEFIGRRNELAKTLRAGGDRPAADRIKSLGKPSVTAWAVNALYHHERDSFDALLDAAAAVRAALAGRGDRKEAEAARRKALRTLLARSAELLADGGHAVTPAGRQRISHSLETLAATQPEEDEPRLGRLTADLEPPGFDVLAGLAASLAPAGPAAGPAASAARRRSRKRAARTPTGKSVGRSPGKATPPGSAPPAPDKRLLAARQAVEEGEAAMAEAERQAAAAETAAAEAKQRHERLTEEAAEAERLARAAAKALAGAKEKLATANKAASRAQTARRGARSRLATARRKLEQLEG